MAIPDITTLRHAFRARDIAVAFALLTRLPLPHFHFPTEPQRPRPAAPGPIRW
ncbi:hypothetical protein [Sulfitobacter profundi]|uniref:GNAT family N-acetyltransferase n=1 Tax=Sulfitobacter profundi TaxID=2679961 RepID=A0ABW1YTJ3_9RHOB